MRIKQVAITAWQQQQAAETQQAGLPVNTSLPLPSNVQTALQTQITQLFADLPAPPPRSAQQQAEMRNLGRQDQLAMRRLAGLDRRDMRSNDDRYEAGRCAVCFETDADESNPLVPCSRCSIYVHAWCYGISTPVSGAEWCCRRCEKRSQKKIECAVCPRKGGALKPTSDGRWAHVTCGLWLPECRFLDMVTRFRFYRPAVSIFLFFKFADCGGALDWTSRYSGGTLCIDLSLVQEDRRGCLHSVHSRVWLRGRVSPAVRHVCRSVYAYFQGRCQHFERLTVSVCIDVPSTHAAGTRPHYPA
jgi:hypothetical protein